jgi:DNA-binding transcriptional ArsR family regulator
MNIYANQSQLFKVLMHPTRLAILDELRDGEQCVCHMEAKFGLRQAYISQHLMILRDAGLVTDRRDGWNIFYSASRPEIYKVIDDVREFIDPISETRAGTKESEAGKSGNKRPCPCPKCNAGAESMHHNGVEPGFNKVETGI